jgi:hypothetical protein
VNTWSQVFLGTIAVATLAIAVGQVGVLIAAAMLARRIGRLLGQVEHELKPALEHVNAIARDASRAVTLATAQVERADRLFAGMTQRLEAALGQLQSSLGVPAREGKALLSALRATLEAVREARRNPRSRRRVDEEDALFI